jgi:retron-type reverse transcriptase
MRFRADLPDVRPRHRIHEEPRTERCARGAVGTCRTRCWRYDWVVDLDIKGFFDNIDNRAGTK